MIPRDPEHAFFLGMIEGSLHQLRRENAVPRVVLGGFVCVFTKDGHGADVFRVFHNEPGEFRDYKTSDGAAWFLLRRFLEADSKGAILRRFARGRRHPSTSERTSAHAAR